MMDLNTRIFLKKKFKEYYFRNNVPAPAEVSSREFGVGTLDDKIRVRHKSFESQKELTNYLKREAPFFISYSAAYYEYPTNQPMDAKNWDGADLVFDLDTDVDYLSREKMEKVKRQTRNLMEFLTDDFNFPPGEIRMNFSGGKGYHIHVISEGARYLDGQERREVIDYITGTGLDLKLFLSGGEGMTRGPRSGDRGWAGRIYDATYDVITENDPKMLKQIPGIGEKTAAQLIRDRQKNMKSLERGQWDGLLHLSNGLKQRIVEEKAINLIGDTDRMVTLDTSRLMRLPDSLHGGTGLKAMTIKDLDAFDPLEDAVVFPTAMIDLEIGKDIPKFELGGEKHGPYRTGERVSLPEYAGVYLMLKGSAMLAD